MANLSVRNVPDEVHRALRVRATQNGRSTEAEIRAILEKTLMDENPVKLGSLLVDVGRRAAFTEKDASIFDEVRDKRPAEPDPFE